MAGGGGGGKAWEGTGLVTDHRGKNADMAGVNVAEEPPDLLITFYSRKPNVFGSVHVHCALKPPH